MKGKRMGAVQSPDAGSAKKIFSKDVNLKAEGKEIQVMTLAGPSRGYDGRKT